MIETPGRSLLLVYRRAPERSSHLAWRVSSSRPPEALARGRRPSLRQDFARCNQVSTSFVGPFQRVSHSFDDGSKTKRGGDRLRNIPLLVRSALFRKP